MRKSSKRGITYALIFQNVGKYRFKQFKLLIFCEILPTFFGGRRGWGVCVERVSHGTIFSLAHAMREGLMRPSHKMLLHLGRGKVPLGYKPTNYIYEDW